MVEVEVARLGMDPGTQAYVVILQEKGGTRILPIWIGHAEADSIVRHMHQPKPARPLTHDLCRILIGELGARLERIQITHVESNTYFGELWLARNGQVLHVDSRPSDAIAIAIRASAPIFVADTLLRDPDEDDEPPGFMVPGGDVEGGSTLTADQLKQYLEHLRPEDFGKFNL